MSLIRSLHRPKHEERSIGFPYGYGPAFMGLAGGAMYASSTDQALHNAATWACIDVLTDAISRTPVDVVRAVGNARAVVNPTPKIIDRPSGLVTADVWRSQLAFSLLTDGNAFGHVTQFQGAYPSEIELLDPKLVSREVKDGRKWIGIHGKYDTTWDNGGTYWHMPGRMIPAGTPYALSPVTMSAKATGMALGAEDFSNQFFADGGHPTLAVKASTALTVEDAQKIKERFMHVLSGRSREPVVYGDGLDIQQLSKSPSDTSFIELMRFAVEQICRFWRVPPAMVYGAVSGQNITYANVTDADLAFLKHSLDGYFVRLETGLTDLLPRPQIVKANRNAILRSEVAGRVDIYDLRLRNKTITVNEVRALEDEEPFDDPLYDEPGIPGITPNEVGGPTGEPSSSPADPNAAPNSQPKDTNGPDA